jgi:hypothetical protein
MMGVPLAQEQSQMSRQPRPVSAATRAAMDEVSKLREDAATEAPAKDRLEEVHELVALLRDAEMTKDVQAEALKQTNITINDLLWTKLPTVMDEARLDNVTIQADGNKPPYTVKVLDDYKANIPGETAEQAYALLEKRNAADLIKISYTVSFGLGESKEAERFERSLSKANIVFEKKRGVPWNTLTAWFREEYKKKPLPAKAMELLGATVGRVAKVVKQKEKK